MAVQGRSDHHDFLLDMRQFHDLIKIFALPSSLKTLRGWDTVEEEALKWYVDFKLWARKCLYKVASKENVLTFILHAKAPGKSSEVFTYNFLITVPLFLEYDW